MGMEDNYERLLRDPSWRRVANAFPGELPQNEMVRLVEKALASELRKGGLPGVRDIAKLANDYIESGRAGQIEKFRTQCQEIVQANDSHANANRAVEIAVEVLQCQGQVNQSGSLFPESAEAVIRGVLQGVLEQNFEPIVERSCRDGLPLRDAQEKARALTDQVKLDGFVRDVLVGNEVKAPRRPRRRKSVSLDESLLCN